jgi:hypothetical protein
VNSTQPSRPSRRHLAWLIAAVLLAHVALLLGLSGALDFQLQDRTSAKVSPLQTRMIAPPAPVALVRPTQAPVHRPRLAQEAAPAPSTVLEPAAETPAPEVATTTPSETTAPEPTPAAPSTSPPLATAEPGSTLPPAEVLPHIPLGALPPSSLLRYDLTGQEKGLTYYASGELNWQHNDQAYALALSVKAFLVGSRHWRSVGEITAAGLSPRRFSDSWRGERAAHFDRDKNRVVFSNNATEAPLLAGAQDQISLYVQLAAAMAGTPERFVPGARVQIQTVTLRDALPWLLTLEQKETLTVAGKDLETLKWVCQPRQRFDAKVEFWVSAQHQWLPARIRITQVNGNYIDLNLRSLEKLSALPIS